MGIEDYAAVFDAMKKSMEGETDKRQLNGQEERRRG